MAYTEEELKKELEQQEYQYGFTTDIESETFPIGLCLLYTSPSPRD